LSTIVIWIIIIGMGALGLLALLAPSTEKSVVSWFTRPMRVRVLGAAVVLLAVLLFLFVHPSGWHGAFTMVMVVLLILGGGVSLILPDTMIVFNEAWIGWRSGWHRLMGIVYMCIAGLFYLAWSAGSA
jgi:hypothetical protein